jgi:thiol-disulfide isomerase/thioredoxin
LVLLPVSVIGLLLMLSLQATAEKAPLKIGDVPPRLTLQALDGKTVSIPGHGKGSVVILHFWADWCQYCLDEMPALERLYQQYRDRGFIIYAVNVGQTAALAGSYVKKVNITYPVLLDTDGKTAKEYDVRGLPRTFFLDRKGFIRYKLLGEASEDTLRKLLLKTL